MRENRPTNSLHVVIHHDHISAHVDLVSPLHLRPARTPGYSIRRTVAHNLSGMAQDLLRLLRGRQGDHRSELDCRWVWDAPNRAPDPKDLLDPAASAWSLQLEARVSGPLEEPQLLRALTKVLGPPPASHAILQVVDCPDDGSLDAARSELYAAPVPVVAWPPVRAQLARHPGGDVLMLNVNHAASDGFGALRILQSIAQAYADDGDGDPVAPLEFPAVADLPVQPASAPVPPWLAWSRAAVERLRDLLARPARLAPDNADDRPGYGFHLVRLSPADTRGIVDPDRRAGNSRNILLAAAHLAIGEWNLRHGTPGHRVGTLVQVNLRPMAWDPRRVANLSVTARVSTSRRHRVDRTSALDAIGDQTTRNKRARSGTALIEGLDRTGLLALWAKQSLIVLQPLTRNRLIDTAMLTNLGPLDQPLSFGPEAGDAVDVWSSAPSRAPLSLCIGAVTVAGSLHLVFRYPHRVLGADAAHRFADCYLAQLRLVAGAGAGAGAGSGAGSGPTWPDRPAD